MAHAKTYTIAGDNMTIASRAVTTLLFLNPPATGADLVIRRSWISQIGTVVMRQRINVVSQVSVFPTAPVAIVTPSPHNSYDTASIITGISNAACTAGHCAINLTTEGAGASTLFIPDAFDAMAGWLRIGTPEELHDLASGSAAGLGVTFQGAAPTLTGWIVGLTYSEE